MAIAPVDEADAAFKALLDLGLDLRLGFTGLADVDGPAVDASVDALALDGPGVHVDSLDTSVDALETWSADVDWRV